MVMVGADPDALDAAAAQLASAADEIDDHARTLPVELQAVWWAGQVASRFAQALTGDHVSALRSTSDFLRRAAQELNRQANEQCEASRESSGSISGTPGRAPGAGSDSGPELSDKHQRALRDDLIRLRHADPAQQLIWWQGLTDDERAWLLANHPGELTGLGGLPEDVREKAKDAYSAKISDQVMAERFTLEGSLGGTVKILKLEAGFVAEMTTFKNGQVTLSLDLEAGAGVSVKIVEALVKAGLGGTLRFANAEAAQRFLEGLIDAARPKFSDWMNLPGGLAAEAGRDVAEYLLKHKHLLESARASVGVESQIDLGAAEVQSGSKVTLSVDGPASEHEGRITIEASQAVSAKIKNVGEVTQEVKAALGLDGTSPKTLSFDFSLEGLLHLIEKLPAVKNVLGGLANGTAHIKFDLTDPQVRAAAAGVVDAVKRGDVTGAMGALSDVVDRAEVIVQGNVGGVAGKDVDIDAGVVEAQLKGTVITNAVTFVKPPGGAIYRMD